MSHLLRGFPHTVGLENADVRQKVAALCSLSQKSSGARPQRGASPSSIFCVNVPQVGSGFSTRAGKVGVRSWAELAELRSPDGFVADKAFPGMAELPQFQQVLG